MSPVKVVKFREVDESFGLDLLQELARAYTASSNTRMQVVEIAEMCVLCYDPLPTSNLFGFLMKPHTYMML